jgi:hypothetical protein
MHDGGREGRIALLQKGAGVVVMGAEQGFHLGSQRSVVAAGPVEVSRPLCGGGHLHRLAKDALDITHARVHDDAPQVSLEFNARL